MYVYAIPEIKLRHILPIEVRVQLHVGTDRNEDGKFTNVNTLIVASACKTVISSYPGLPGNMFGNTPGGGRPVWNANIPSIQSYFR